MNNSSTAADPWMVVDFHFLITWGFHTPNLELEPVTLLNDPGQRIESDLIFEDLIRWHVLDSFACVGMVRTTDLGSLRIHSSMRSLQVAFCDAIFGAPGPNIV